MGKKQGGRQNERPDRTLEVTRPSEWKTSPAEGDLVELPSGNVVRLRRPGMQQFVDLGMVPNPLMPIIDDAIKEHKAPKMDDIIEDETLLAATAKFMDDVFLYCVMEPEVLPMPADQDDGTPGEREDEALYLDQVDMEDRLFVFQYAVGGTRSVQRFRQYQVTDMATLAAESILEREAQQPA